nr:response regulator [Priestia megaterium]MDH3183676.1 response regulator [Priestia megaterium]
MLRTVIVEDEISILNMMKYFLDNHSAFEVLDCFANPEEAVPFIRKEKPDVVFLDIEMPRMNGLELAELVRDEHLQIVFTTAYSEYAVNAFQVEAIDYLVKPVSLESIERTLVRLLKNKTLLDQKLGQTTSVPSIQCFGLFKVTNKQGEIIKWPTQKKRRNFLLFSL